MTNQTDPLDDRIKAILVHNTKHISTYTPGMENIIITLPDAVAAINAEIAKARIDLIKWTIHHLGVEGEDWTIDWLKAQLTTPEEGKENE